MKLHCIMIMFFKEYYYYYNYYYHIHIYIYIYIEIPKHTEQCFQDGLLMMFSPRISRVPSLFGIFLGLLYVSLP